MSAAIRKPTRTGSFARMQAISAWFLGGGLAVTLGVVVGFYIWAPGVVQRFDAVVARNSDNTIIFDRTGEVLATIEGTEDRHTVPLSRISPHLQKSVVGIEDRRFFGHRDHTTVIYAVTKIRDRAKKDRMFRELLDSLCTRLVVGGTL